MRSPKKFWYFVLGSGLVLLMTNEYVLNFKTFSLRNTRNSLSPSLFHSQTEENMTDLYHINTPTCVIPNIPFDHPSIAKYLLKDPIKIVCSSKDPLTEDFGLSLKLYLKRAMQYGISNTSDLSCFYQGIIRIEQDPDNYNGNCDRKWKLNERKVVINDGVNSVTEKDGIMVQCHKISDNSTVVYKNIHFFIQPSQYEEKMKQYQEDLKEKKDTYLKRPNVLIVGIDSVARNNLLRYMPKTYEYLTKTLGAIDLRGYNKVGDNTFPNLMMILAGLSYVKERKNPCFIDKKRKMDDCPFIWKEFSSKGYVTFYTEDATSVSTFKYIRTGFVKPPTDLYPSSVFMASDQHIGHGAGMRKVLLLCQGGRLSHEMQLDYAFKAVQALHDKVPYFGFAFPGALTHDLLSLASAADQPTVEFFTNLWDRGYLENTILFFLSDHGMRYGAIRSTYAGMLEERLPFVLVLLPQWFKDSYPEAVKNLRLNTRRLTSNADIHATLHDIVDQTYANISESYVGKYGQSLFREVPLNRTCADVVIDDHFCTCENKVEAKLDDPHLLNAANHTVHELNVALQKFNGCVQLSLDKIKSGRVGVPNNNVKPSNSSSEVKNYLVVFSTKPGGAEMEATVRFDDGKYRLMSEVSRINAYGNQSHCIEDFLYRNYCYCKDLL